MNNQNNEDESHPSEIVIHKTCIVDNQPTTINLIINPIDLDLGKKVKIRVRRYADGSVFYEPRVYVQSMGKNMIRLANLILRKQNIDIPDGMIAMNLDGNTLNCTRDNIRLGTRAESIRIKHLNQRKRNGIHYTFNKNRPTEPYDDTMIYDPATKLVDEYYLFRNNMNEDGIYPDDPVTVYIETAKSKRYGLGKIPLTVDFQDIGYALRAVIDIRELNDRILPPRASIAIPEWRTGLLHPIGYAILGVHRKKGYEIDHINRNTLDNRRCNLRFVTSHINQKNKMGSHYSYTGIVSLFTDGNRYRVSYRCDYKRYSKSFAISDYPSERDAIIAAIKYAHKCRERHGRPKIKPSHFRFIDKWNLYEYI